MSKLNVNIKSLRLLIMFFAGVMAICCYYAVHFSQKSNPEIIFKGSESHIKFGVYSSNGKYLATCDSRGFLKIWNIESGKCIHSIQHKRAISAIAISADSHVIAYGDFNGNLSLRNVKSGKIIRHYKADPILAVAFSQQGLLGYATSELTKDTATKKNKLTIIRWKNGDVINERVMRVRGISYKILSFAFSPDGNKIACITSGSRIMLFGTHREDPLWDVGGTVWGPAYLVYSPDGKHIATSLAPIDCLGQVLNVSDGSTYKELKVIGNELNIRQSKMYYATDGHLFILGVNNDQVIFVINMDGEVVRRYKTHEKEAFDILDFSPNRKKLAIAYGQDVGIWNIT